METIAHYIGQIRIILIGMAFLMCLTHCEKLCAETVRPMGQRVVPQTQVTDYEIGVYNGVPRAVPLPNLYRDSDGPLVTAARDTQDFGTLVYAWFRHHYIITICAVFFALRRYEQSKLGIRSSLRAGLANWINPTQVQPVTAPSQVVSQTGIVYDKTPVNHGA